MATIEHAKISGNVKTVKVTFGPSPQATTGETLTTTLTQVDGDYTDEQFYADLEKASLPLNKMAANALKAHKDGRTRKFPA